MATHKPKMHELIAVESTISGNYQRDLAETIHVFGKPELFQQVVTNKVHFEENDTKLDTHEEKALTTTVKARLDWFSKIAAAFYDVQYQKDKTNQAATADIVLPDGKVLANALPATTLLMLETKLQDMRAVLVSAPTLTPGVEWAKDDTTGWWKQKLPTETFSTRKVMKPVVLYPHTDKHPAQVKEITEDVTVAKITKNISSGMLSSSEKADLLGRLDTLLGSVKTARQRANTTEAATDKIGDKLTGYLFG